jgi:hypothetical protein
MKKIVKKPIADVNKFSLAQMLSNPDGKTSASGAMGVFICVIGGICFLVGSIAMIFFKGSVSDILVQSISMVYAGALLLGFRKSADAKTERIAQPEEIEPDEQIEQEKPEEKKKTASDPILDGPINS